MLNFDNKTYFTIEEVSKKLKLHYQSVARILSDKKIPYKKLGRNKFILESDIEKFFN